MDDSGEPRIPQLHVAELSAFFAAHDRWLFGHACVRTRGDRELAADLVQDTFEAAARAWRRCAGMPRAGNAAGLFPAINPSATPSPSPGSPVPGGQRRPVSGSSAIAFVQPGLTGQVAGLIALAVAVLLTVTRLSLRKRFRSRKQSS